MTLLILLDVCFPFSPCATPLKRPENLRYSLRSGYLASTQMLRLTDWSWDCDSDNPLLAFNSKPYARILTMKRHGWLFQIQNSNRPIECPPGKLARRSLATLDQRRSSTPSMNSLGAPLFFPFCRLSLSLSFFRFPILLPIHQLSSQNNEFDDCKKKKGLKRND